jgi:UDP-N-acetylglucosamine 1-carboxyvinyltransferase
MDVLKIIGGRRLVGTVPVSGAKNAALPILAAALLAPGVTTIRNVPRLRDIDTIHRLLREMGATVTHVDGRVEIDATALTSVTAPYELVKTMRAAILVLGPLLARCGAARVSLPGGCAIGARPVNLHIHALERMGAGISIEHGYINGECSRLRGADITFDLPTVTGTENLMMAATLATGVTILRNAAREPEVVDLAAFLRAMGARLRGEGTDTIVIEGVKSLCPADYRVMPDRIEAATFMVAAGITGGDLVLEDCPLEAMGAVVAKLREAGLEITPLSAARGGAAVASGDVAAELAGTVVRVRGGELRGVDAKTMPYPGFPTDVQPQLMVLMCVARGSSVITETIFENRFMHVLELQRMGADIELEGRTAMIRGGGRGQLSGAPVMGSDLRASAALVLAGLAAKGETRVLRIYHLDRGYDRFEAKLGAVGAEIARVAG